MLDTCIVSKREFTPKGTNPQADVLHDLYKDGFQSAASIGCMPVDADPNPEGSHGFKSWELYEYSLVLVSDNPEALTMMRSKALTRIRYWPSRRNLKNKYAPAFLTRYIFAHDYIRAFPWELFGLEGLAKHT